MTTLTIGSLFSGIGGFDLAAERAGMKVLWQCEIDQKAQDVLRRHFPETRLFDDVRLINRDNAEPVDIIVGGFPCQDLSIAGKREGLAGERSGLWYEFARIIDELEPGWVVIENVPGLLSSNKGRDFSVIICWLAERGYGVAWRVLDAQYFGVAQRRRRVFIVGSLGNGRAGEVLFEQDGVRWNYPTRGKAGKDVAGTLDGKSASSNRGSQANETDFIVTFPTIDANMNSKFGSNQWVDSEQYVMSTGQANAEIVSDGEPSLTANHEQPIVWEPMRADDGYRQNNDGYNPSLRTVESLMPLVGIRRLTPTECERLQGFPDGWTEGQSDTARYKQLGNAVAVPVVEWIMQRIACN